MKVFQELQLRGSQSLLERVIDEIEKRLKDGWTREQEQENQFSSDTIGRLYCFSCPATDEREAARVWIATHQADTLYVSNIVPLGNGQFSVTQYNQILAEFYNLFAKPVAKRLRIKHELTSDTKEIEGWVPAQTAEKLRKFSQLANKSTGSAHPLDRQRWFNFLVAVHKESIPLDARTLAQWLAESEGWSDEEAHNLSVEYDFARSLLTTYDEARA